MDSVVHYAVEEICSQGVNGLTLRNLWPKLQHTLSSNDLHLCDNVKRALWTNLLNIPGLQFESRGVSYNSEDSSIQSFEDCERLELKIVAAEHLRNSYVGIYDIKASDAGISLPQRRALERLAIARSSGIAQSELAKEFGMKGNNIFYILRNLEARGLIVRQSTILRRKEASSDREPKNSSIVNTNMLHLYRYAKHLGCQQRLEITKEDLTIDNEENVASGSGIVEERVKEDVHIKDYLPALKAICDKLEEADGKVLLVADIKRDLGYRGRSGHRSWRNICHRLKDAHVVEEFTAKVNTKEVSCLRLLKKFSPKNFEPKSVRCGSDDVDTEEPVKLGRRGHVNDQIVELPIEHQVYEMIDAEGSKGLTITELCKRLGLKHKRYYTRLLNMFSRFGMHLKAESHNRGVAYRVWTSGNFTPEQSHTFLNKPDSADDGRVCTQRVRSPKVQENSTETAQWEDHPTSDADATATGETEIVTTEPEVSQGLPALGECDDMPLQPSSSQNVVSELNPVVPDTELQIVSMTPVSDVVSLDFPHGLSAPRRRKSYQTYPCLTLNALSTLREKRILELLQDEKFMIKADLHRQLESLEKDKNTMLDRKTLVRSLNRLQEEGLCKCIRVGVPVVTNCDRSRTMDVVLHPSVNDVSPELLAQIYERVRSFDMQIRSQGSSKSKNSQELPVLNSVQRILNNVRLNDQSERSEAMRANGFVLAKMVRTKLMHIFLWGYLKSLPCWNDDLSPGKHGYDQNNPHSTCKVFELQAAIKAMPLELFLQVAGSTQNFEEMIVKCRNGFLLSDLPVEEYKHLMGTQATGRLSYIIDILRRLKLIRMVRRENSEDEANVPHTTLTHALELKPYIEEPVSVVSSPSALVPPDIRPHIRHDFVLSSIKAVDEYWNTLEYCYAAVDSKAAVHAFPGSTVHEVFLFRSWASTRVMSADQRAELLKRIINTDPNKKLSFNECNRIAKELGLTLEQVLRVYYDKRKKRLTRLQGVLNPEEEIKPSPPRKRKRHSKRTSKHVKVDSVVGDPNLPNIFSDDQHLEEQTSREREHHLLKDQVEENAEGMEEFGLDEADDEDHAFVPKCAFSTQPTRQRKFYWTEDADRDLLKEYARHRAALGARFHRTDWSALPNLPAAPDVCKRRMNVLNNNTQFRKAVMGLCNILSDRYAKHLTKFQSKLLCDQDCRVMVRDSSSAEHCSENFSDGHEPNHDLHTEERWDNFNNEKVAIALDEVLRYKRMAKLVASREVYSVSADCSDLNLDSERHEPSGTPRTELHKTRVRSNKSSQRSSYHRLQRKYVKFLNEGVDLSRQAYKSLAVSNAVELFKLVFLSTSTAPEVPNLLAETLRRYSEHDLFAAFNYLREAKIMVGGSGTSPFVLSQQFIQRISSSPYPPNTGKRGAKFASWLHEKEKSLMEEGIDLPANLQCGDVIYLTALLSSREMVISPNVPDQGVGEADEVRLSKRKCDNNDIGCNDKAKKPKTSLVGEGEMTSRREKGFPGIKLSLSRATISRLDAVELFKERDICSSTFPFSGSKHKPSLHVGFNSSDRGKEVLDFGKDIPITASFSDSMWEAMTSYAENLVSLGSNQEQRRIFSPQFFTTVYTAIQKAGDQGLSMEEISRITNMQGDQVPETAVEVLEAFGKVLKVNAYDSVHVVDSLYRSKYCLTSLAGLRQDTKEGPTTNFESIIDEDQLTFRQKNQENGGDNVQKYISMNAEDVHRVTILNLPEDVQSSGIIQNLDEIEGSRQARVSPPGDREVEKFELHLDDSSLCRPILPWINGDGTINEVVYRGLVRRVLGILMQNPGILEGDILSQMSVLNPQSCRKLLELMILDDNVVVRKMHQATSGEPPAILSGLLGSTFKRSKLIFREHFFANPATAATLL